MLSDSVVRERPHGPWNVIWVRDPLREALARRRELQAEARQRLRVAVAARRRVRAEMKRRASDMKEMHERCKAATYSTIHHFKQHAHIYNIGANREGGTSEVFLSNVACMIGLVMKISELYTKNR